MVEEHHVGAFVGPYRPGRRFFFIISLLTPLLRSTFVSGARHNGFIQVVGLIVLETLYLISLIVLRPYYTRGADALEIFLSLTRLITTGALIAFVKEKLAVTAIPRVGIGIGLAVVWCVGIVVVIINILVNILPWKKLWCRITGRKHVEENADSVNELEKGTVDATLPNSEAASTGRSDSSIAPHKEHDKTAAVDDNERTRNTMMVQQNDK
ncbi:10659_t:CDS:1 [Acaulospora colombiana]|uniref:10659_t:CDS:1 n=1 Tax=Acaulospora colombiana TaxID=27376 RepID=A0ACA9Q985_9GLOM|nr:10659_t:CDS:1 [Acaulospora colombiana]